jgi:cob(I)alamin adenosyltransferase
MKIYTKTGDKGQTSLYDQHRINKDDIRVESYGTIDELNSSLGFAKNFVSDETIFDLIEKIQRELFNVAGELATLDGSQFPERIGESHIKYLENQIDALLDSMGRSQEFRFILPGSNKESAALHISRTICRRAERRIVTLSHNAEISPHLIQYVNRLADMIYTMARFLEDHLTYIVFDKSPQ